jgi:hypothetical protein
MFVSFRFVTLLSNPLSELFPVLVRTAREILLQGGTQRTEAKHNVDERTVGLRHMT